MPYAQSASGVKIYYEVYGEGEPIVLVHGNPCDHWLWLYQIPVLSYSRKVIAVDLRAYGRSGKPTTPFSIEDLADDLLAVMEQEGLRQWALCGLSIGASVVMDFTLRYQDKVAALILVGAGSSGAKIKPFMNRRIEGFTGRGMRAYLPEYARELFSGAFLESQAGRLLLDMYVQQSDRLDVASVCRMYEALSAYEATDRLAEIAVPTLIIAGEQDMAKQMSRAIHERIADSRFEIIPGGSHACCMDSAATFNRALLEFLGQPRP